MPGQGSGGSRAGSAGSSAGGKDRDGDANATADVCGKANLVDSSVPPHSHPHVHVNPQQRFKTDCKPEELQKLKTRCEVRGSNLGVVCRGSG